MGTCVCRFRRAFSNRRFFRRMHGNATSELNATTTTETRKEAKKKCVTCAHFLAGFVAVIVHCDRRFKNLRPSSQISTHDYDFVGNSHTEAYEEAHWLSLPA